MIPIKIQQFANVSTDQTVDFNGGFAVPFQAEAENYEKKAIIWPQLNWKENISLNTGSRNIVFNYNSSVAKGGGLFFFIFLFFVR